MKYFYLLVIPLYLCVVPSFPAWSQPDVFQASVRPTEPLTPSDQLKTFHVPQGFQIALVTSEPVIAKPMNMAFDHRGRLWVTTSDAYPWSITPGQEHHFKDSIVILDDQDGDGSPEITTTFATGLNIPIGIYPYRDGAIVWSIDNIWNLQDTDQDGVADTKEVLYGPVGKPRDTHGMHNAFRRGYDGQLYINHGFNNDSTISGNDGSQIKLNSGNTYRIRLDGSHVEQFSWGQVNPFGSSFDKFGYLYTADCHSQPIYQIIPQAYYPSFGKPHDGLGFAPMVMQHSHGSTAISGLVIMDDTNWPDEYMDNIFVGNVMTSRINRDQLTYHHASPEAHELPDFLISDDPWFRPVDLQWGPDGALYIADFYNKIIGHYEVDLNHPERDRHRGRIWRVSYHGTEGKSRWNYPSLNLSPSTWSRAVKELESPNRTRRHIALDFLTDQMSDKAVQPLRQLLASNKEYKYSKVMALWGLQRLNQLSDSRLMDATADSSELMRTQAFAVMADRDSLSSTFQQVLLRGLDDPSPLVRRAAAHAMARHPAGEFVSQLINHLSQVSPEDDHMMHQIRIALRNVVASMESLNFIHSLGLSPGDQAMVDGIIRVTQTQAAAEYILDGDLSAPVDDATLRLLVEHVPLDQLHRVVGLLTMDGESISSPSVNQFAIIKQSLDRRGLTIDTYPTGMREYIRGMLHKKLSYLVDVPVSPFTIHPDINNPKQGIPWTVESRRSQDKSEAHLFISSLSAGGESLTGTMKSQHFIIPDTLTFHMCGHRGSPDKDGHELNYVQLVESATGQVLRKAFPPRQDLAQPYTWSLAGFSGQMGYLELVDGDSGSAYAWLAIGRISPQVLSIQHPGPREKAAAVDEVLGLFRIIGSREQSSLLWSLFERTDLSPFTRNDLASALIQLDRASFTSRIPDVLNLLQDNEPWYFPYLMEGALRRPGIVAPGFVKQSFPNADSYWQLKWSKSLISHPGGRDSLYQLIYDGDASLRILTDTVIHQSLYSHVSEKEQGVLARLLGTIQNVDSPDRVIQHTYSQLKSSKGNQDEGRNLFIQHCASCHQKAGQGELVGPQLDGIRSRGLQRLIADIYFPNENVDQAFALHQIETTDTQIHTGLALRTDGLMKYFRDPSGRIFSLNSREIVSETILPQSPMPGNFSETLSLEQLSHLTTFLLAD